jgi:5'(3')-deoxyribonucleotidase
MPPVDEFWTSWNADQESTNRADRDWIWTEGVERGLFRYGHMVKGARRGLEALVEQGHKLSIVTHRPENAVTDTLEWAGLYFKGIPLAGFNILSQGQPKTTVGWDVLIDDKPENIADAEAAGRIGIMFSQPWNQDASPACRVRDWRQMSLGVEWVLARNEAFGVAANG